MNFPGPLGPKKTIKQNSRGSRAWKSFRISPGTALNKDKRHLREAWSARELERQIASLLFERLAKSRDKDKFLALAKKGQEDSAETQFIDKVRFARNSLEIHPRTGVFP
jgi:hypothetical protein